MTTIEQQIVAVQQEIHRWQAKPGSLDDLAALHKRLAALRREAKE